MERYRCIHGTAASQVPRPTFHGSRGTWLDSSRLCINTGASASDAAKKHKIPSIRFCTCASTWLDSQWATPQGKPWQSHCQFTGSWNSLIICISHFTLFFSALTFLFQIFILQLKPIETCLLSKWKQPELNVMESDKDGSREDGLRRRDWFQLHISNVFLDWQ